MADVFLSYAREDRDTASRLVTALQANGWSVWWDARITAGQEFPPAIREALEAAHCVVVLWSASSIRSSYVEAEAIRARDRGVLLPASLDDVRVPVPFNTLQTVSLARWTGGHEDDSFRPLARAAQALIDRDGEPAPPPEPEAHPADDSLPNDCLSELTFADQRGALALLATRLPASGVRTDEGLGLLTEFAAELSRTLRDFPEGLADCDELLLTWNAAVDDRLAGDRAPMTRLVLARSRSALRAVVARAKGQAAPALDTGRLLGPDPIEASEAVDALLQGGFEAARPPLAAQGGADRRAALAALWRSWTRIRLYHACSVRPLKGFALHSDASFWHPRLEAIENLARIETPEDAAAQLETWKDDADRQVLAETLLVSGSLACRKLALETLAPPARLDTALAPGTPLLFVREIVARLCQDGDAEHVKALFLLLRRRLHEVKRAADVREAYGILRAFYGAPVFLEEALFSRLLALHEGLRRKALASGELRHLEQDSLDGFKSFCSRERLRGADLEQMAHIPLAIQRKLAHDGLFAGYFVCNARDAIALETVPHVLRLPDVLAFIRLLRINGQALHTIAKDKTVMREYAHRLAFCRNPRAKGPELDGYMSSLRSTDWDAIARDRNASQRAREQARRLLSKAHA